VGCTTGSREEVPGERKPVIIYGNNKTGNVYKILIGGKRLLGRQRRRRTDKF
jgi:hypothetical protein